MKGTAQRMETDLFAEFASKVVSRLPRDLDSTTAQGWIENPAALTRVLREAFMPPEQRNGTTTYPIEVNYWVSIEDAVKLCRCDWSKSDITSEHFPTTRAGEIDILIELVHFNRNIWTENALRKLDQMGFRPAELHELLALGAKYPDLQREFPIVALGSVWQGPGGSRYCAYLDRYGSERALYLLWLDYGWGDFCRFAAVRK